VAIPPSADNHRGIFVAGDLGEVAHYVALPHSAKKGRDFLDGISIAVASGSWLVGRGDPSTSAEGTSAPQTASFPIITLLKNRGLSCYL